MGMSIQELGSGILAGNGDNLKDEFPERFDATEQDVLWLTNDPELAFYREDDIHDMISEIHTEQAEEVLKYVNYPLALASGPVTPRQCIRLSTPAFSSPDYSGSGVTSRGD